MVLRVMSPVLPPLESNFSTQKRGMIRVLLEGFSNKTINTVFDIKRSVERTLLAVASTSNLLETGAQQQTSASQQMQRKAPPSRQTTCIEEVFSTAKSALDFLEGNRFITWDAQLEVFVATALGDATVASSLAPDEALLLYRDLSAARSSMCLENDLHLLFMCTPYYHGVEPDWSRYVSEFLSSAALNLPEASIQHVTKLIGVDLGFLHQCSAIPPPRGPGAALSLMDITNSSTAAAHKKVLLLHRRFYVTLVLWDVINETPPYAIARKFGAGMGSGELRRLRELASTFANMAANFCEKLNWWQLPPLLERIATRLSKGVEADLLPLMCIEGLTASRARELAKKGFRNPLSVASASVVEIESILTDAVPFTSSTAPNDTTESEVVNESSSRGDLLAKLCTSKLNNPNSGLTKRNLAITIIEGARNAIMSEANELAETLSSSHTQQAANGINRSTNFVSVGGTGNLQPIMLQAPSLLSMSMYASGTLQQDNVASSSWVAIDAKCASQWNTFVQCVSSVKATPSGTDFTSSERWVSEGPFVTMLAHAPNPSSGINDLTFCIQGEFTVDESDVISYNPRQQASSEKPYKSTVFFVFDVATTRTTNGNDGAYEEEPTTTHITRIAVRNFLSKVFFPSNSFVKVLPDAKVTLHGLRQAGLLPYEVALYPSIIFPSTSCGPVVDPYIADWMLSPEDRSSYRSPPLAQLCESHGEIAHNTLSSTKINVDVSLRILRDVNVKGELCPPNPTSSAKVLRHHLKRLSKCRALQSIESGCLLAVSAQSLMMTLLRKLSSLNGINSGNIPFPVSSPAPDQQQISSCSNNLGKFECQIRCLTRLEMPTMLCLVQMEANGIGFESKLFEDLTRLMDRRRLEIEAEAYQASGGVSNWDLTSPKDCARILYDVMKLPSLEHTFETKYLPKRLHASAARGRGRGAKVVRETRSTKQSVLKALQRMFPNNPLPNLIMEHRTMVGWSEKYLHAILQLARPTIPPLSANRAHTSTSLFHWGATRVHGTFLQTSTATGRLTMEDPNLQTIPHPITFTFSRPPAATVEVALRRAFVAQPFLLSETKDFGDCRGLSGSVMCFLCSQPGDQKTSRDLDSIPDGTFEIVSVDYTQIEARLLAHFSGDENLLDVFRSCSVRGSGDTPTDIFNELARQIQKRNRGTQQATTATFVSSEENERESGNESSIRSVNNRANPLAASLVDSGTSSRLSLGVKRQRDEQPVTRFNTNVGPTVTPDQRKAAKTLCYGMIYGKGANAIAEDLDVEVDEAKGLLADFRSTYHQATAFIESVGNVSGQAGFAQTITGRRRWLPYAGSNNPRHKSASDRITINTICQGSAADVMKLAMINLVAIPPPADEAPSACAPSGNSRWVCCECLRRGLVPHRDLLFGSQPPARLILQIHDELLFEVCSPFVPSLARVLKDVMNVSKVFHLKIPLAVSVTVGPNYEDMTPFRDFA